MQNNTKDKILAINKTILLTNAIINKKNQVLTFERYKIYNILI